MNLDADLERYIARYADVPFQYGQFDCVTFCAAWVDERAGTQHAADLRRRFPYTDAAGALEVLGKHGGLGPIVTEYLGFMQPPASLATGDIALLIREAVDGQQQLLGIVAPSQVLVPWVTGGVVAIARDFVVGGWACPCERARAD